MTILTFCLKTETRPSRVKTSLDRDVRDRDYIPAVLCWMRKQALMLSAAKQGSAVNKTVRQHIVDEQGGYCLDAARVEEQLRYVTVTVTE